MPRRILNAISKAALDELAKADQEDDLI